jgi:hypothetical protein
MFKRTLMIHYESAATGISTTQILDLDRSVAQQQLNLLKFAATGAT